jgi:GPI mannosyltransferase 3
MYLLTKSFESEVKSPFLREWFVFLSLLLWFMPYIHARFSSENWAGLTFWIGVALLNLPKADGANRNSSSIKELLIGVLFGFSITLKFQVGFMMAGLILWLIIIRRERYGPLILLILGALIPMFIELPVDRWFYGDWAIAPWNYFKVNIIEGKVSEFGINPWWYYFKEIFFKAIPPFSIFIIINTIVFWIYYSKHVVTWMTVPFILVHSIIGHKDIRFLFPMVNILPFVLVASFQVIDEDPRFLRVKAVFKVQKNMSFGPSYQLIAFCY